MYDCIVSIAEKEIRLCKNIAKFLQNLPFQLAKFCILDAKFEIFFFLQKTAGTDIGLLNFTISIINNIIVKRQALKLLGTTVNTIKDP